jgi:hypothetical protein
MAPSTLIHRLLVVEEVVVVEEVHRRQCRWRKALQRRSQANFALVQLHLVPLVPLVIHPE